MIIEEMTDAQFEEILAEVPEIQYLIILAGKMATKTRVEDVLVNYPRLKRVGLRLNLEDSSRSGG